MNLESHFAGKNAVVTGAASGIGKALAGALTRRGANVVLADIDDTGAKEAADALAAVAAPSAKISAVALDVTDRTAVREVVDRAAADLGRLDFVFNNAGIGIGGPVTELSAAHWDRAIDVNVRGVVHGVLAAYPIMVKQGSGHIVNTASLAGLLPFPMGVPYGMAKHAVVGLSTGLRIEAAAHGVRVSVICPGVIDTPILDKGNPPDLPALSQDLDGRDGLSRLGKPYPPAQLAEDVLVGVARNKTFIVSPRHARVPWRMYRTAPAAMVAVAKFGFKQAVKRGQIPYR